MGGLSESAVIMVVVGTGLGETLHLSLRNADSFRIKRRAFRLLPPDDGLLVYTDIHIILMMSQSMCLLLW